ncbi:hypothetical protein KBB17_01600 [Candidatus Saccharibacteria bacterium]|nr:hypothetical protein [Candidatus Saccharibacteria bacterium]MBP9132149.1 hypothetical protein [Candidatus Saccharibacteria bacterium]
MKIALVGNGRTGNNLHKVVSKDDQITDFNTSNPPTVEALVQNDVIISFLPGDAFTDLFDMFIESKVPVVTGSTGFDWPDNAEQRLIEANIAWVSASNFSLGMQLVHDAIVKLGNAPKLLDGYEASIDEIHHIHKKDSPSGTSLKWREWFGDPSVKITSHKQGETVGDHSLKIETATETIEIKHHAKDRTIFAGGALWAARRAKSLAPGLHMFEDIVDAEKEGKNE